jgi:hypothetical protein
MNQSETIIACGGHVCYRIGPKWEIPSIDASYQVSVHLASRFQRRCFKTEAIRNKNCLWWPCFLTNRAEMSNRYREPSIEASYKVTVHFVKRFHRTLFLEIEQSETRIVYDGHIC